MGLLFSPGDEVLNSAPPNSITGTVTLFTIGGWFYPTVVGSGSDQTIWSLTDTAGTANWWRLTIVATTNNFRFGRRDSGGGEQRTDSATGATANAWTFFICRGITAANMRLSVRHPSGLIEHNQNTTSRSPAGIDSLALGGLQTTSFTEGLNGVLGEFWYTDADIQGDGAQLSNDFLHQLAFGGPFSVPHVAASLLEYRSLRNNAAGSRDSNPDDVFFGKSGPQTWVNANPKLSHHPPLPYWYKKPGQASQIMVF